MIEEIPALRWGGFGKAIFICSWKNVLQGRGGRFYGSADNLMSQETIQAFADHFRIF